MSGKRRAMTSRRAAAGALAVALALPAGAELQPDSGARFTVRRAEIEGLECVSRGLRLENAAQTAGWFPYMWGNMTARPLDPRPIALGTVAMLALVPLTMLAVPTDLAGAPFRRACRFTLRLEGAVVEWAGRPLVGAVLSAEARNLRRPERPARAPAEYFVAVATATTDASGRFAIAIPGATGRSRDLDIGWLVDGRPSALMRLRKSGGRFTLTQEDAGFGAGVHEMPPLEIRPGRPTVPGKGRPDRLESLE